MSDQRRDADVRRLAYELWEAAGKPEGEHLRFWFEAERRLEAAAEADDALEEGLEETFPASDVPAALIRHARDRW